MQRNTSQLPQFQCSSWALGQPAVVFPAARITRKTLPSAPCPVITPAQLQQAHPALHHGQSPGMHTPHPRSTSHPKAHISNQCCTVHQMHHTSDQPYQQRGRWRQQPSQTCLPGSCACRTTAARPQSKHISLSNFPHNPFCPAAVTSIHTKPPTHLF